MRAAISPRSPHALPCTPRLLPAPPIHSPPCPAPPIHSPPLPFGRYGLDSLGHTLDSLSLGFRYIAGYTPPEGQPKLAANVTVQLTDAKGAVLRSLFHSAPLGNFSYDVFDGYSPPVVVRASGIGLQADGRVYVSLLVHNNERNLQIALDDLGSGFNVTVGWA